MLGFVEQSEKASHWDLLWSHDLAFTSENITNDLQSNQLVSNPPQKQNKTKQNKTKTKQNKTKNKQTNTQTNKQKTHTKKQTNQQQQQLERFSVFIVFGLPGLCGWQ